MKTIYVRRLLAPIILSLFAIGWYKFSETYLVYSNELALSQGRYAVYVTPQAMSAYLINTLWFCYFLVFVGLGLFWYNLVKIVKEEEKLESKYGIIDVVAPVVFAVELIGLVALGDYLIGLNSFVRILAYASVYACLMWFWYALVKYIRVIQVAG